MKRGVFVCVLCLVVSTFLSAITFPTVSAQGDGWGTAELIERDYSGTAEGPQVGVDSAGNAIGLWHQSPDTGAGVDIRANRYVASVGWTSPRMVYTGGTETAYAPQIAVDPSGNGVAVWQVWDGFQWNIWANRYAVGADWGTGEIIQALSGDAGFPRVAVDSSGNAVAVWQQHDGVRSNINANRYVVGTGWGIAETIEMDDTAGAYTPSVAVDSGGNATAVWVHDDGTRYNIYSNRYLVGTGWGTAELIEADTGNAATPEVAVDSSGNAIAVWGQLAGTPYNIYANRYVVGTGWETAELIETDTGNAEYPQVAVDLSGNAVAVWWQSDGTRDNIWANRYVVGTGWGTAELIETDDTGPAREPQVAVDPSGNAVTVWMQDDGTFFNIYANRFVVGTGWGAAELVEAETGYAAYPQLAVDPSGNAVAVWYQDEGTRNNIWANRYVVGTGWGTAEIVEFDTGDVFSPHIAINPNGNGMAVWTQVDSVGGGIWASRFVSGIGWATPDILEWSQIAIPFGAQVAVDPSGNAMAVWYQPDSMRNNIWASRYVVGTGWGISVLIENDAGDADSPEVAMDAAGNAVAVWQQWGTAVDIWANRYVVGTGWGTPELLETGAGVSAAPQVAVSPSGDATAVWYQNDGIQESAWANRYVVGTGWETAELIETDDTGDAYDPRVAMDAAGYAVAVWQQWEGAVYGIWSNRYVVGTGWGTAGPIETDAAVVGTAEVAVDPSGNTVAVWPQGVGPTLSIWANRYVVGTGWGTAELVETDTGNAVTPQVAVEVNGSAVAVWRQSNGAIYNIWANRYVVGTGWGAAELIETDDTGDSEKPYVAVDSLGNAVAVWTQFDGAVWNLWANNYTAPDATPPVADAGFDQTVTVGTLVAFDGSGSTDNRAVVTYGWTFDDGGLRTLWGVSPTYAFYGAGVFDITLTVWDAAGNNDTDTLTITVGPPPDTERPVADAGPDQSLVVGATVMFNGSASTDNVGVTDYTWTFDDGGARILSGVSPSYRFDNPGTFVVTLAAKDAAGNSDSDVVVITVAVPPDTESPIANAGPNQTVIAGTVVAFDGSGSTDNVGITNYTWTFDDGGTRVLYVASPVYRFNNVGAFGVTLTVEDAASHSGSDVVVITVTPPPDTVSPFADAGPDRAIFAGTTIVLDGSASTDNVGILNYTWTFDDGGVQVRYQALFDYAFNNVGVITINFTVRDAAGNTDADTVVITVSPPPDTEPPVSAAGTDQFVATGTLVTFAGSGSTDNVGITNYTWTFDDGGTRTLFGPSPTYRFDNVGAFVVVLAVRDAAGNTDSDVVVIAVTFPPDTVPPLADAGPDQVILGGTTTVLDGSGSTDDVGIVNYTWTFNDGGARTRYTATFAHTFSNVGVVTITLAVRDAAGNSDSDAVAITVLPPDTEPPTAGAGPDQVVTAGTLVTFDGSGSTDNVGVTNYTWTFVDGGARTLYGTSPTYTFSNVGAFVVVLAVRDAAGNSDSDAVVIAVTSSPDTEPPVSDAGPDRSVYTDETVVLDGTASTDNVGVANYTWTFTYDGTTRTLFGPLAAFRFEIAGNYTIILAVRDAAGNSDTDAVTITSSARPGGGGTEREVVPPAAIAGLGAVAILEAALALRLMSPRRKGRDVPKREEKAASKRGAKEEEAPAKEEPEPEEDEYDL